MSAPKTLHGGEEKTSEKGMTSVLRKGCLLHIVLKTFHDEEEQEIISVEGNGFLIMKKKLIREW
jgi:hypothetical protein